MRSIQMLVLPAMLLVFIVFVFRDRDRIQEELNVCNADKQEVIVKTICDKPKKPNCDKYIDEMEKWIKTSDKSYDRYVQCTLDLATCQNEMNMESMCVDQKCIGPERKDDK